MKNRKILAGPYLFWAMSFIIIPLLMILYYGLTDKNGSFTLNNLSQMTTPENLKALGLALLLSFISTLICLVLAYPLAMILAEKNMNQTSFIVLRSVIPYKSVRITPVSTSREAEEERPAPLGIFPHITMSNPVSSL